MSIGDPVKAIRVGVGLKTTTIEIRLVYDKYVHFQLRLIINNITNIVNWID